MEPRQFQVRRGWVGWRLCSNTNWQGTLSQNRNSEDDLLIGTNLAKEEAAGKNVCERFLWARPGNCTHQFH